LMINQQARKISIGKRVAVKTKIQWNKIPMNLKSTTCSIVFFVICWTFYGGMIIDRQIFDN